MDYLNCGWSVVPVGMDKRPVGDWKNRQTARMTPQEVEAEFSTGRVKGVAVVCGRISNLQVLDFDGEVGLKALAHLESLIPQNTPRVQTGSGGVHLYFSHEQGQRIKAWSWRGERAGELRGEGGFVVAPPSAHPSGQSYRWIIAPDMPLPEMPQALKRAIFAPVSSPRPQEERVHTTDRVTYWLERAILQARSGSRNSTGFWLACQLRDMELPKPQAKAIMDRYAQAVGSSGQHPYRADEALASLEQAYNRPPRASQDRTNYANRVLDRFRRLP